MNASVALLLGHSSPQLSYTCAAFWCMHPPSLCSLPRPASNVWNCHARAELPLTSVCVVLVAPACTLHPHCSPITPPSHHAAPQGHRQLCVLHDRHQPVHAAHQLERLRQHCQRQPPGGEADDPGLAGALGGGVPRGRLQVRPGQLPVQGWVMQGWASPAAGARAEGLALHMFAAACTGLGDARCWGMGWAPVRLALHTSQAWLLAWRSADQYPLPLALLPCTPHTERPWHPQVLAIHACHAIRLLCCSHMAACALCALLRRQQGQASARAPADP